MQHRSPHAGRRSPPIWPFLLLLVFLFGMSITSPRHWEKYAQRVAVVPPANKTVSTSVATPITDALSTTAKPSVGAVAQLQPRVTGQFTPFTADPRTQPKVAEPTFAQPNLARRRACRRADRCD
ncbi:MAG: hypothetical protein QM775_20745 [Pirellulales bacterium]